MAPGVYPRWMNQVKAAHRVKMSVTGSYGG
jgi:hypothetical protein